MIDFIMQEAMEEVDKLTPSCPPIAPPRAITVPKPWCYLGVSVDGVRVVRIDPLWHGLVLSDGRTVDVSWLEDRMGPARPHP